MNIQQVYLILSVAHFFNSSSLMPETKEVQLR